jgi:hypothetical protein
MHHDICPPLEGAVLLTAVENGSAGTVSRRSKMAAHNRPMTVEYQTHKIEQVSFKKTHVL